MMALIGICVLVAWYTWKGFVEKGTGDDLEDCEGQLDALIRQIRKTEQDRDEIVRSLPAFTGTLEQQVREIEHELQRHEELLPVNHNLVAAKQRYQSARKRAEQAAHALKQAKNEWRKVLQQLGLADSLSPKSIRILAEGYESLIQSRRRLKTQEDDWTNGNSNWQASRNESMRWYVKPPSPFMNSRKTRVRPTGSTNRKRSDCAEKTLDQKATVGRRIDRMDRAETTKRAGAMNHGIVNQRRSRSPLPAA